MSISVVICGLVRDPSRLMSKIHTFANWRSLGIVDQVVYSTWIGEVDRYKGLRDQIREAEVMLLEIEEPRLILKGGHQLHQMLAFHYGLAALENPEQFVLKTRVDLADNHESMLYDFQHGTPAADDFANVGFRNRILIENGQMLYPFLCGDAQFFGRLSDLRKLLNLSAEMELIFNRLAVEQTFFFQPFSDCRLFRRHFYWNLPHISEIANQRAQQIQTLFDNALISQAVKAWWLILDAYFKIGWGPYRDNPPKLSTIAEACVFDGDEKIIGGDRSDVIASQSFVTALVSLLDNQEISALKSLITDRGRDNPFNIDANIFEEYEAFRRQFSDLPSSKAVTHTARQFIIRGAAQHIFAKDPNDEASKRYHEQITFLRRENDYLKKQLNITLTGSLLHRTLSRMLPRKAIDFMKYKTPALVDFYARYFMKKRG